MFSFKSLLLFFVPPGSNSQVSYTPVLALHSWHDFILKTFPCGWWYRRQFCEATASARLLCAEWSALSRGGLALLPDPLRLGSRSSQRGWAAAVRMWDAGCRQMGRICSLLPMGAGAVLLAVLSCDGQLSNPPMGRSGNVVWQCTGTSVCRALIGPSTMVWGQSWCCSWCFRFGGLQMGSECAAAGLAASEGLFLSLLPAVPLVSRRSGGGWRFWWLQCHVAVWESSPWARAAPWEWCLP